MFFDIYLSKRWKLYSDVCISIQWFVQGFVCALLAARHLQ